MIWIRIHIQFFKTIWSVTSMQARKRESIHHFLQINRIRLEVHPFSDDAFDDLLMFFPHFETPSSLFEMVIHYNNMRFSVLQEFTTQPHPHYFFSEFVYGIVRRVYTDETLHQLREMFGHLYHTIATEVDWSVPMPMLPDAREVTRFLRLHHFVRRNNTTYTYSKNIGVYRVTLKATAIMYPRKFSMSMTLTDGTRILMRDRQHIRGFSGALTIAQTFLAMYGDMPNTSG